MNTVSRLENLSAEKADEISTQGLAARQAGAEVTVSELKRRQNFINFGEDEEAVLKSMQPLLMSSLPEVLNGFYKKIFNEPEVACFFKNEALVAHAKEQQQAHWQRISDGHIDEAYLQAALKIGRVHEKIGLEPHWYIGSYALIIESLTNALVKAGWPKPRFGRKVAGCEPLARNISVFIRSALLDMQLTISAYLSTVDSHIHDEDRRRRKVMDEAIDSMSLAADQLARGDLTSRIGEGFPEEYSILQHNFNEAVGRLSQTVVKLHGNADSVNSSVREIAVAADDMSHRAEHQASSLEESTGMLTELSGAVRQTSSGIEQMNKEVKAASDGAINANQVVREAGEAMEQINNSSRKIGNIIGMIDEIAFQTNLLALNAGVEAARAGDAGRGFAVVATEVRALAQRSADAAREIKALISQSGEQVSRGVDLVQRSGAALAGVAVNIGKIDGLAGDVFKSSQSQSAGLEHVSQQMSSMSGEVQKNAAMAEQTTASIHSLRAEIASLNESLNTFKV